MSQKLYREYTCDRCGTGARLEANTKYPTHEKVPEGWGFLTYGALGATQRDDLYLCGACYTAWYKWFREGQLR